MTEAACDWSAPSTLSCCTSAGQPSGEHLVLKTMNPRWHGLGDGTGNLTPGATPRCEPGAAHDITPRL